MQIFREIQPLRAFLHEKRHSGYSIGFVPTMGALHAGHLELIRASKNENDLTICSIFVNPTQFNNPADLKHYPRTFEKDSEMLKKAGCDVIFFPEVSEIYPSSTDTALKFDFGDLERVMEGKFRPGHFSGVALVVSKLFHIVEPKIAYFGQKDWQQFAIISKLVHDLNFNLSLQSVTTVRESDGLAMSSRNLRLTPEQRLKATVIYRALNQAVADLRNGKDIDSVKKSVQTLIEQDAEIRLEYVEVADSANLSAIYNVSESEKPIICIAAFVGEIRLIDNMFV